MLAANGRVSSTKAMDVSVRPAGPLTTRPSYLLGKPRTPVGGDPFTELGTTGLRQYGGFVLEEWLQQLQGRREPWAYREMIDNDPVVGGIMFGIKMLARKVQWWAEGYEGKEDERTEFVWENMHDMSQTWIDVLCEAISFVPYGWAFHELCYKHRNGPQRDTWSSEELSLGYRGPTPETEENSSPASSQYKDGKIGWRKIPIRAQETLLRWHFDGYSGIQAMEQVDWHGGQHVIPIQKALLFRTETNRNNPQGRPALRNCWIPYYAVKNIQALEAIGIERDLAGIPVAVPPEGVDLFEAQNSSLLQEVRQMVNSIRRDEYEGVVLPSAGWKLELLKTGGSRQINTDDIIRRYEQRIAASLLADFILVGLDGLGSYAMVDVKSDLFGVAMDTFLDLICEPFNRYAIPRLLALNGMSVENPPQIRHSTAGRIDLEKVGNFFREISVAGAPIPWSKELIGQLFTEAGLPATFDDETFTTREQPEGEVHPLGTQGEQKQLPAGSSAQSPGGHVRSQERANASKAEGESCMVSIDLPAGTLEPLTGGIADHHITLVYAGRGVSDQDFGQLCEHVSSLASETPILKGTIGGIGSFPPSDASDGLMPTFAIPNIPGLEALREPLEPWNASEHEDFKPHVTLAYLPAGSTLPPPRPPTPVKITHLSVHRGDQVHAFPLGVKKAEEEKSTIDVSTALKARAQMLQGQLESEMKGALDHLGREAARAYMSVAEKAEPTTRRATRRIIQKVLGSLNLENWISDRLMPLLKNHAGRVTQDTQKTVQTVTGQEINIAEQKVQQIARNAGIHLDVKDIEPQIRTALSKAIEEGFRKGQSPLKTAELIEKAVPPGRFVKAGSGYRAELIARDETASMQRDAALGAYESMPNVTAIRLRDGIYGPPRSDSQCINRDGETVPIGEAHSVAPYHLQCSLSFDPVVGELIPV